MKSQSSVYRKNVEARTSISIVPLKGDVMKFLTNNYKTSILLQPQGFGLVTPDPFSSHELGGVWVRNYPSKDLAELQLWYIASHNTNYLNVPMHLVSLVQVA